MDYGSHNPINCHYVNSVAQRVQANSLVRDRPAREWIDGHPLGNGDLGVMALGDPVCFRYYLSKSNVWDDRTVAGGGSVLPEQSWDELKQVVKSGDGDRLNEINTAAVSDYSKTNYPSPQSCGVLSLAFADGEYREFSQTLSLYKGQDDCRWFTDRGSYELTCFVHQDRSVSEYDISFLDLAGNSVEVSLGRAPSDEYESEEAFCEDGILGFVFTFPDGLSYANALALDADQPIQMAGGKAATAQAESCRLRILQAIVTSEEAHDPKSAVIESLRSCLASDRDSAKAECERYWGDFWDRSYIDLQSDEIEKIWYMGIYLIGSSSRPGAPAMPGLQGVWIEDYSPPWKGDYHTDLNIQMNYWPVYTANHLDLAEPFYRVYKGLIPRFKQDTQDYYGAEGMKVPIAHDRKGNDLGGYIGGNFWQGASAWIASHFWRNYLFSGDVEFLKDIAFPFFLDSVRYYNDVLQKDESGRYVVAMSWTPEEMEGDQIQSIDDNPTIDLSLIGGLYSAYLQTVDILGATIEEPKETALAREISAGLADYPKQDSGIDDQTVRPYLRDSQNRDYDYSHRHCSVLTPIYPSGEMNGFSSSVELHTLGVNTFHKHIKRGNASRRMYYCLTYTWLAGVAATLGLKDTANQFLSDYLDSFVNDNYLNTSFDHKQKGRGVHVGDVQEFSVGSEYEFAERIFQLESNCCAAEAVNLMLLQSFGGGICVFPAYPWKNGAFEGLRAEGGFLVSSRMCEGRVESLFIKSLSGNRCQVFLDNSVAGVAVTELENQREVMITDPEENSLGNKISFQFDTCAGQQYSVAPVYTHSR